MIFLILFVVLLLAWIFSFAVFHVAGAALHILLVLAVISLIVHFVRGGRRAAA
ncbi:MAG TPA: lmo0937 family membrane protein [Terriglobales bacterium]|nr:lmo0937 family membrane protein [Terriglobales bacterium]